MEACFGCWMGWGVATGGGADGGQVAAVVLVEAVPPPRWLRRGRRCHRGSRGGRHVRVRWGHFGGCAGRFGLQPLRDRGKPGFGVEVLGAGV